MKKFVLYFFLLILTIPVSLSVAYFLKASRTTGLPAKQLLLDKFITQWDRRGSLLPSGIYQAIEANVRSITYDCTTQYWRSGMQFMNYDKPKPLKFGQSILLESNKIFCTQSSGSLEITGIPPASIIVRRHTEFFHIEVEGTIKFELSGTHSMRLTYESNVLEFTPDKPKAPVHIWLEKTPIGAMFRVEPMQPASVPVNLSVKLIKRDPNGTAAIFLRGSNIILNEKPIPADTTQQIL